ncbi:CapA family protein [Georgenia sp. Z1491]|uniref:CapA family protein n=1 Tax=Georgenia sp. Z1491 TaxID=3416707 RepID=UPI003CF4B350
MPRLSRTTELLIVVVLVVALAVGLLVLAMRLASGSEPEEPGTGDDAPGAPAGDGEDAGGESGSDGAETPSDDAAAGDDVTFTLAAAGDVITYPLMNAEAVQPDGSYDYWPMIEPVAPYIAGADLALCNLEVPITQEGAEPVGYPVFAAPPDIVPLLAEAGYDGCSTATNHSVDQQTEGVIRTIEVMEEAGLGYAGTARTPEEQAVPQMYVLERGGRDITVAHVAATYSTNGIPVAEPHLVDMIDDEPLVDQAVAAREAGADVVVASMHWGDEYTFEPNAYQQDAAQLLADSGEIDLVLGSHPHTPQPIEQLEGGVDGQGMWVVWSMGNSLASQQPGSSTIMETAVGLMTQATITVPADGPARVDSVEWMGTVMDSYGDYGLVPLHEALADPSTTAWDPAQIESYSSWLDSVMGDDPPSFDTPLEPTGEPPRVEPRS